MFDRIKSFFGRIVSVAKTVAHVVFVKPYKHITSGIATNNYRHIVGGVVLYAARLVLVAAVTPFAAPMMVTAFAVGCLLGEAFIAARNYVVSKSLDTLFGNKKFMGDLVKTMDNLHKRNEANTATDEAPAVA